MTDDEGGEAPCFAHLLPDEAGGPSERPGEARAPSEADLAQLVGQLADAVVVADAEGTITLWNPAAARLFGWPAGQALGRSLDLIVPPRYRDRHWEGYRRVMATGHTRYGDRLLEVPALHREGHRLSIAFTVTLLRRPGADRPHAIAAVVRDETERWQEHRRLTEELARLRAGAGPD
ncbi:MAG TPA: PAS domain-containing protein [Acidimicrobiales bacterium]|nr:PAS domain-containing protein [Acidimicrobiales bacterium]